MTHVLERISETESRHELIAEQDRERSRQTHAPITLLLRTLEAHGREYLRAWNEYEDNRGDLDNKTAHHPALLALERATAFLARATATLSELLEQPKETLLSHEGLVAFQERIRAA